MEAAAATKDADAAEDEEARKAAAATKDADAAEDEEVRPLETPPPPPPTWATARGGTKNGAADFGAVKGNATQKDGAIATRGGTGGVSRF